VLENLSISSRPNRLNGESLVCNYPTLLLVYNIFRNTFLFSFIRHCYKCQCKRSWRDLICLALESLRRKWRCMVMS